jgi:N4-gp56 family major capsid protein
MATVTTATGSMAAEIREHYNKTLLYKAKPELVHAKYAKHNQIPKGEGKVMNFRRFSYLSAATTPLTEGVPPSGSSMTVTNVPVTANQYGDFVQFSDRVTVQSIDPILTEQSEIQGQQAGNTMDIVARDVFNAGTSVRYANGRVSRVTVAAGDVITDVEIKKLRRALKRNNCKTINGSYIAIVHPDTFLDLQNTDGFKNTGYYSQPERIYDGDVIKLYGIMFVESTNAKVFTAAGASSIDVYSTICFGMEAFGDVDIESLGLEMIYKPKGSAGTADPLNQVQSQGWKATYAALILNDAFCVRLEHAVSA